jgi:hypothetical protein
MPTFSGQRTEHSLAASWPKPVRSSSCSIASSSGTEKLR